jgi:hypothetical protein
MTTLDRAHGYHPNPFQTARPAVHVYPNCAVCNEPYWSALHPVGTQPHAQNGATA